MKVLSQDKRSRLVKLRVDTLDDLWHLSHIIAEGDLVRAKTQRRQEDKDDMVRDTGGERITVTLGVTAEQIEFHESSQRLRVLGLIDEAPEGVTPGTHHTLSLGEHDWVEVVKPDGWPRHVLDRITEAVESTHEPKVTIVAMDDDDATIAVLHQFGVREIGSKRRTGGGKQYKGDSGRDAYYEEVREVLATTAPEGCPVIVVGPGFARENFVKFLKENKVDRIGALVTEPGSVPGMTGVHEAVKRGVVRRVAERSRLTEETEAVEALYTRLGTTGLATYGPKQVEHALNIGAVERLLVTDEHVKTALGQRLLELADRTGAEHLIVGTGHEAGTKLAAMTGIAALLRFKVPD